MRRAASDATHSVGSAEVDQYALLDFGGGRKLERFGHVVLDRPCPACQNVPRADPQAWQQAAARFVRQNGQEGNWQATEALPEEWTVNLAGMAFALRPSPSGHIGVFVEQINNWSWLSQTLRTSQQPVRVLNLFAYSGGSTLAAATANAEVTHVDAAKNMVRRARANAELSSLGDAPIRWIVEDAARFCQRELRRGRHYDAVILDPPSYGTGPHGEQWRMARDLSPLLEVCSKLTGKRPGLLLATCHTTGMLPDQLTASVADAFFAGNAQGIDSGNMCLIAKDGRRLHAGIYSVCF